jgi:hypothetical protein
MTSPLDPNIPMPDFGTRNPSFRNGSMDNSIYEDDFGSRSLNNRRTDDFGNPINIPSNNMPVMMPDMGNGNKMFSNLPNLSGPLGSRTTQNTLSPDNIPTSANQINNSVMGGGYNSQHQPVDGNGNIINYGGSQGGVAPTNMANNPLSQYSSAQTTGYTPAPNLGVTAGGPSGGSFGQGSLLPNVTTTQQQVTAAPSFYTDYLNNLANQGQQATQGSQFAGTQPLQQQAFNQVQQNVGNYQPTLQSAINLASNVGQSNLASAIGNLGEANIRRNLAPQATAGLVGSGQFGSSRGATALGDTIANAELGITAEQAKAMQQDYANRMAASQQLGTLAGQQQTLGLGDVNALSTLGGQQQTIAQNQQLFPMQQLMNQAQLLRGYTIPTSVSASQTGPASQGQFSMSPLQQIATIGTLAGALGKPSTSYIDPKTGKLVEGTSVGGNMISGLGNLINKSYNYLNTNYLTDPSNVYGPGGSGQIPEPDYSIDTF